MGVMILVETNLALIMTVLAKVTKTIIIMMYHHHLVTMVTSKVHHAHLINNMILFYHVDLSLITIVVDIHKGMKEGWVHHRQQERVMNTLVVKAMVMDAGCTVLSNHLKDEKHVLVLVDLGMWVKVGILVIQHLLIIIVILPELIID